MSTLTLAEISETFIHLSQLLIKEPPFIWAIAIVLLLGMALVARESDNKLVKLTFIINVMLTGVCAIVALSGLLLGIDIIFISTLYALVVNALPFTAMVLNAIVKKLFNWVS